MRLGARPTHAALPNPDDRAAVREWQARGQSPAAHREAEGPREAQAMAGVTPAGALRKPEAPGPEGLAEQFAFKVAQGIFGRDIAAHARRIVRLKDGKIWDDRSNDRYVPGAARAAASGWKTAEPASIGPR